MAVGYAAILHFFSYEQFLRPVVEDIVEDLPSSFTGAPVGVPLRWKLLGALPLINVITGVVVSGLSTNGDASLHDLGLDVVVAVLVAFTISLELTRAGHALGAPAGATGCSRPPRRVKTGDLDARVPVTSGDELGQLAGSFNEMMEGLSEREALREAFGAYVDPDVAERVLEEGELIEGQEREVTVMILDVRDFTEFAERSSARETVAFLNDLFGIAVPCVTEHGGHANKFLGDGLLAVFGAPERLDDHADRAVAAAREHRGRGWRERFGEEVRFGIGVNSGPVVVGSVGGGGRLEFAVIGDPVNVAARVEHLTRETGDTILITEATRCLMVRGRTIDRELDTPRRVCAERRVGTRADLRNSDASRRKFEWGAKNPSSPRMTVPKRYTWPPSTPCVTRRGRSLPAHSLRLRSSARSHSCCSPGPGAISPVPRPRRTRGPLRARASFSRMVRTPSRSRSRHSRSCRRRRPRRPATGTAPGTATATATAMAGARVAPTRPTRPIR